MVGIYKITSPSNKVYIGQSWDIDKRIHRYKGLFCERQKVLYNSIKKHGFFNHIIEVIHELPIDVEQKILDDYEMLYIQLHKDCGIQMLNLTNGGGGCKGMEVSLETREKLRKHNIGKKYSEETKIKLRGRIPPNKGIPLTDETKRKLSIALKGRAVVNKGVPCSDEHKAKISSANKGRVQTDEEKLKRSKSLKGRATWSKGINFSEEHKTAISNALKGRIVSDETRKKIGLANSKHTGRKQSIESIQKMIETKNGFKAFARYNKKNV